MPYNGVVNEDRRYVHLELGDGEHVVLDVPAVRPTKACYMRALEPSDWPVNMTYDPYGVKIDQPESPNR